MGSQPNDPLLDANEIVRWLFDGLNLTPKEAKTKAASIKSKIASRQFDEIDVNEALELRRLRGKIVILGHLQSLEQLERYEGIKKWLEIKGQLI